MTAKIIMRQIKKEFQGIQVLNGVNLEVNEGESLAIIGTSGSGKSVTLKCLLGILEPDSGEVIIDGIDFLKSNRKDRETILMKFGVTFQGGALFDSLSVWENISFRLIRNSSYSINDLKGKVKDTLKLLGLQSSVMNLYPSQLSGGMQKRVAIARAIIEKPDFLVFDEPTSGLDPITGSAINELILDSVKRLGSTTITITHDMASVKKIADKVAMIHQGKIEWFGKKKDIFKSGNVVLKQFVNGNHRGPLTSPN